MERYCCLPCQALHWPIHSLVCKHMDEVRTEKVNSSQFYNRGNPSDKDHPGYHAPRLEEGDPRVGAYEDSTTTKKVGQLCGCCDKLGLTRYILHCYE